MAPEVRFFNSNLHDRLDSVGENPPQIPSITGMTDPERVRNDLVHKQIGSICGLMGVRPPLARPQLAIQASIADSLDHMC